MTELNSLITKYSNTICS